MNFGYLQRQARRKATMLAANEKRKADNAERIDHICTMYEDAFFKWSGEHVKLRYMKGRYYIPRRGHPVTERTIVDSANRMLAQIHEEELMFADT